MNKLNKFVSSNHVPSFKTQARWFATALSLATKQPQLKTVKAQEAYAKVLGFDSKSALEIKAKSNSDRYGPDFENEYMAIPISIGNYEGELSSKISALFGLPPETANKILHFITGEWDRLPNEWKDAATTLLSNTRDISHLAINVSGGTSFYLDLIIYALENLNGKVSKKAFYRMLTALTLLHSLKESGTISRVSIQHIWCVLQPSNYTTIRHMVDRNPSGLSWANTSFSRYNYRNYLERDMDFDGSGKDAALQWKPLFQKLLGHNFFITEFDYYWKLGLTATENGVFKQSTEVEEEHFYSGVVVGLENELPDSLSYIFREVPNMKSFCQYNITRLIADLDKPNSSERLRELEPWVNPIKFYIPVRPKKLSSVKKVLACFEGMAKPKFLWNRSSFEVVS